MTEFDCCLFNVLIVLLNKNVCNILKVTVMTMPEEERHKCASKTHIFLFSGKGHKIWSLPTEIGFEYIW